MPIYLTFILNVDVSVRCPNLADPANGRVSQGGNRPRDRASYFCDREYRLVGEASRICQDNGEWSGEAPTCERQGELAYNVIQTDTACVYVAT